MPSCGIVQVRTPLSPLPSYSSVIRRFPPCSHVSHILFETSAFSPHFFFCAISKRIILDPMWLSRRGHAANAVIGVPCLCGGPFWCMSVVLCFVARRRLQVVDKSLGLWYASHQHEHLFSALHSPPPQHHTDVEFDDPLIQYQSALYYTFVTLTTTGYGDISATTSKLFLFSLIV